jgi:hypothetical protein
LAVYDIKEVRNDIYLTLVEGVYEKGSKTAQKNIEVVVTAFNSDGGMIEVSIFITCCRFSYYTFLNRKVR